MFTRLVVGLKNTYVLVFAAPIRDHNSTGAGCHLDDFDIETYNVSDLEVSDGISDPASKAAEFNRAAAIQHADKRNFRLGSMVYMSNLRLYRHAITASSERQAR